jgi:hypothetical protein
MAPGKEFISWCGQASAGRRLGREWRLFRGPVMQFLFTLLWNWIKDTQFHKTAASAAAGTSIGMLTILGLLEQKIDTAKAEMSLEVINIKTNVEKLDDFVKYRKAITDERFEHIDQNLKYLRGAIDVTNQNILNLSHDIKRSRN